MDFPDELSVITKSPSKGETQSVTEGDVIIEVEVRTKGPQAKKCGSFLEARKGKEGILYWSLWKDCSLADDTSILAPKTSFTYLNSRAVK